MVGEHVITVTPIGGAGMVDMSCFVTTATIRHGREGLDPGTQPDASTATLDLVILPETGPLPPEVEIGSNITIITIADDAHIRFTGTITDLGFGWDDAGPSTPDHGVAQILAVSGLADLGRRVVGDAPFPQELDGARVSRVMAAAGVTLNPAYSDPGTVQIIARDVDSQPALDVSQATAQSAAGIVWATRTGDIRYADAEHRRGTPAALTLDACNVLVTPTWRRTLEGMTNEVSIGYGVKPETGDQPRYVATQPSSIARYGRYGYTTTTELAALADATALGQLLLARNGEPVWIMANLPVDVAGLDSARTDALLELDMHSLLSLTGLPAIGAAPTSANLWVEGWQETLTYGGHDLELVVSGYCRTSPPPRWDDVDPTWVWGTDYAPTPPSTSPVSVVEFTQTTTNTGGSTIIGSHGFALTATPLPGDVVVVVYKTTRVTAPRTVVSVVGAGATWAQAYTSGARTAVWVGTGATTAGGMTLTQSGPGNAFAGVYLIRGLTATTVAAVAATATGTTLATPPQSAGNGQIVLAGALSMTGTVTYPSATTPTTGWTAGTVRGDTAASVSDAYRIPSTTESHTTSVTSTTSDVQEVISVVVGAPVVRASTRGALVEDRRNLATQPRAVSAGWTSNDGAAYQVTLSDPISDHPLGITTAAKVTRLAGSISAVLVSIFNVDGLGNSGTSRAAGVWVQAPATATASIWLSGNSAGTSKTTPVAAGVWTYCTTKGAGTGYVMLSVSRTAGSAAAGDITRCTGSICEGTIPPDYFDGNTPDTAGTLYQWVGAALVSASTASFIVAVEGELPPTLTWDDAACLGPPINLGRWDDQPATTRWDQLPADATWNTYTGGA